MILENLFVEPFERDRWLKDQQTLIDRLSEQSIDYFSEQAEILRDFQENNQCSIIMTEVIKDRINNFLNHINNTDNNNKNDEENTWPGKVDSKKS